MTQPYSVLTYATRAGAALILLVASLGTTPAFAGSFLTRCSGGGVEGNGVSVASAAPPPASGCTSVALPVEAAQILAAVPAPHGRPGAPEPETITVTGVRDANSFLMREIGVTPVSLTTAPPYLIPGSDLRAVASVHGFGPLGRVAIETDDDQIAMTCEAGSEAAGLAFATARVPPIPGMTLRVVHNADSSFRLVVSDPTADAQGLIVLAKLKPADSATEAHVPLTKALPADTPLDFRILCPADGGRLQLNEIVLEAKSTAPTARATWISDARLWQADPAWIFARAQRWGLTRLYVAIPMDEHGPTDLQALASFIAEANSRGIEVWALLADGAASVTVQGLADYNVAVPGAAQIKGAAIEFSAERRWTYFPDPGATAQQFLDRMKGLKAAFGMPLEAIVPAWFPTDAVLAERYAAVLDGLIVLTDRTEPDGIRKAVTRFLAWGTRRSKPVAVALEIAPMSAAERARFARAESGELWLIPVGGERVLLLLKEAARDLPGVGFQQQESTEVAAETRTFADRRPELRQGLDSLGRTLGAWPSFDGFAFHDLFKEEN